MLDTIRFKTKDEQTAVSVAHDIPARFHPALIQEREEWHVVVETESEDDLPDLLSILYDQLQVPDRPIDVLLNGEPYSPKKRP